MYLIEYMGDSSPSSPLYRNGEIFLESNNQTLLVTIALATYNGEKYLREQLDSLYNQSYKNIEIVVSDDCSTDCTVAILEEYKKEYGLRYSVNDNNCGFVKNFENALKMCKGDYIALCDQDDIWFPEKIEILVNEIKDYSLICSDAVIIDSYGNKVAESMYLHTNRIFREKNQFQHLLYHNFIPGCTMLFKRDILDEVLPFPETFPYHDWWLAIIASLNGGAGFVNRPLIRYRYHGENQSGTGEKIKFKNIIKKIPEYRRGLKRGIILKEINWMYILLKNMRIDSTRKNFLIERMLFFENILNSVIHFRAAFIAFKHRNYMLAKRKFFEKFLFIIMTLFAR